MDGSCCAVNWSLACVKLVKEAEICSNNAVDEDTLMAGQVLAVGDKLISRNGKFAFGFFQPAASSTISKSSRNAAFRRSSWYLGIWFNKIPVLTTVWIANREEPITHRNLKSAPLKISSDGNLAIVVNHGSNTQSIVWSTHTVNNRTHNSLNITSAVVLLNNGNLVLKESPRQLTYWPGKLNALGPSLKMDQWKTVAVASESSDIWDLFINGIGITTVVLSRWWLQAY
ncbi:putative serine/threonine-protein kinase receptor [Hordeum vulgare]|nr:putative serine/threonine-protein kinase receptor [Hordeum vulgare]